jgi:hypothetical protein
LSKSWSSASHNARLMRTSPRRLSGPSASGEWHPSKRQGWHANVAC